MTGTTLFAAIPVCVAFAAATPANAKPVNLQATGSLKTVLTGVATGVPPRPA